MPKIDATKTEAGKWVPTLNGKQVGFGHFPTRKAALEAAQQFAANGVR